MCILLVITNIKNVLVSLDQQGFTLTQVVTSFIGSKVYEIPENYQTLAGLFILPLFSAITYWIEIFATFRILPERGIVILIVINVAALLIYPIYFSYKIESNPFIGLLFCLYSVAKLLKLVSFHHTMYDCRGLVKRAIQAKKEGKKLTPSAIEGTIFGVDH